MNQKKPNLRREKYFIVRCTVAEHQQMQQAAEKLDLLLAELIRRCTRVGWARLRAQGGLPGKPLAETESGTPARS
jgi:hypothetical protein